MKEKDDSSLNEILYKGPCLLPKWCDLLLAFQAKPIVLTGDIEKAFLQIVVHVKHVVYGLNIYIIVNPLKFKPIVLPN